MRSRLERVWIRFILLALPKVFREQNVSLAAVGERHHWLWGFHQLKRELEAVSFVEVRRCTAHSSAVADFPFHPLDVDAEEQPRKGQESMYVDVRKLADSLGRHAPTGKMR